MQAPMTIKQYVSQMRKIPGGRFTMGRTYEIVFSDSFKSELPAHTVDISSFQMGATLVTVGMWREYLRANTTLSMPEAPNWGWIDSHPVVNVSWNDIMGVDGTGGYCAWASRASGVRLTLPTEAQWEYAAKGGRRDLKYPWGNIWDQDKLWCSRKSLGDVRRTAPVVRSNNAYVNQYGLIDMAGNVDQWCFDTYAEYGVQKQDRLGYPVVIANPKSVGVGPLNLRLRIFRGGSWCFNNPHHFRCASRIEGSPDFRNIYIGFRLFAPA